MYYKDYIDQILQDYEQKKAAGRLPLNLNVPTPARLRNECGIACKERWLPKDEQILRDFFGRSGDETTFPRIVESCDIDKFRPLVNFLKNPVIDTDKKNIELLAWLINFEPRPLDDWKKKGAKKTDDAAITDPSPEGTAQTDPSGTEAVTIATPLAAKDKSRVLSTALQAPVKPRFHFKTITIPLAAAAMISASLPVYKYIKEVFSNAGACMYWAGDHYQSVPCSQKIYGSLVIPLDTEKLFHFKKITRPDTITEAGINRISYIRLNGGIEYYTRKGDHPVYTEKSLKPLTEHMYETHIRPLKP